MFNKTIVFCIFCGLPVVLFTFTNTLVQNCFLKKVDIVFETQSIQIIIQYAMCLCAILKLSDFKLLEIHTQRLVKLEDSLLSTNGERVNDLLKIKIKKQLLTK